MSVVAILVDLQEERAVGTTMTTQNACAPWLDKVTTNAYRVLGIPTNSSEEHILSAAGALRRDARLGRSRASKWDLEWLGTPVRSEQAVHNACGKLTVPETRIAERFWWFSHPRVSAFKGDPSGPVELGQALVRTDSTQPLDIDQMRAELARLLRPDGYEPDMIPLISFQIGADSSEEMDENGSMDAAQAPVDSDPLSVHDETLACLMACLLSPQMDLDMWKTTAQDWAILVNDDQYWAYISELEYNSFQLRATESEVAQLRERVSTTILDILTGMGRDSAQGQRVESASRIVGLIRDLGDRGVFSRSTVGEATMEVASPLEDKVDSLCAEIAAELNLKLQREVGAASSNRPMCLQLVHRFEQEVRPALTIAVSIAGEESPTAKRVRATTAECLCQLAIALTWADEFVRAEVLLTEAARIASGTSSESTVRQALDDIKTSAEQQRQMESEKSQDRQALESGSVAAVVLPEGGARIPGICTCCLVPTSSLEKVRYTWTEQRIAHRVEHSVSCAFPLCDECKKHRSQFTWARVKVIVVGAVAVAISLFILSSIGLYFGWFISTLVASAMGIGAAWVFDQVFPLPRLGESHAHRGESMSFSVTGEQVEFVFWHPGYGRIFARANQASLQLQERNKYSKGTSLFSRTVIYQLAISIAVLGAIFSLIAGSANVITPSTSSAAPSSPPSNVSVPSNAPRANSSTSTAELRAQIDANMTRLRSYEADMSDEEAQINNLQRQMDVYKGDMDRNRSNPAAYNRAVDSYNALISTYKQLVARFNQGVDEYEGLRKKTRAMIDEYNQRR